MKSALPPSKVPAREKLLQAALAVIRTQGYSATTVDDLCAAAGVTKGAFFHHFENKEALGIAAADYWSSVTGELFAHAPYHQHADPLDRVLGYLDFRKALLAGKIPEFTCLAGTLVQEVYDSNPAIRDACRRSIFDHAGKVAADLALAKQQRVPKARWTAQSLSLHFQAVLQGAFILSKADQDVERAVESLEHLRRYVQLLFTSPTKGN